MCTCTYIDTHTRAARVLSVCSYAKRARDLRLFCQPSPRLSLVLHSLLCFTWLVLVISLFFFLPFSRRFAGGIRALLSLLRVSFPFPSISLMCESLLLAPTFSCERESVFLPLLYVYLYTPRLWSNLSEKLYNTPLLCAIVYGKIACEMLLGMSE